MGIIGRTKEQQQLKHILKSDRTEFLVVYGRRRVGKTYLIKEFFQESFSFYTTGVMSNKNKDELTAFNISLIAYGSKTRSVPSDWFEAFGRLKNMITDNTIKTDSRYGKKIIFIDELPWFDTGKSNFKAAFEFFWNSFASTQKDLTLIVCGSATSWILKNLLNSRGGFHNRITYKMLIKPFDLNETEKLVNGQNGNLLTKNDIIQTYMTFGGIPYYLNLIDPNFSLVQNIDNICFRENGQLCSEYDNLFSSLFKKSENHYKIIEALATKQKGLSRNDLLEATGLTSGESFSNALCELEECGFIRKYRDFKKTTKNAIYQLIDPFILFSLKFLKNKKFSLWENFVGQPAYYSWCDYAFEILCINHTEHLKKVLGIEGIDSLEYSYYNNIKGGAQIDLLIDRNDNVINLCEMKFSQYEYEIDSDYVNKLTNKIEVFKADSKTRKSVILTFITNNGLKKNRYSGIVAKEITADSFFVN